MLLISRLLGLDPDSQGVREHEGGDEGVEILKRMGVGKKLDGKGTDGMNVWKMVMGDELYDSEGALI